MPYVASGSYGCVFNPHLKCKSNKKYKDGIGKVFYTKEDFESELEIVNIINLIDPTHKYTIQFYDSCETNTNYNSKDEVEKCDMVDIKGQSFHQLIYRNGGKSLMQVLYEKKGNMSLFLKLFKGLYNILEGIEAVNRHGYVHQDIKPDNILIYKLLQPNTDDVNAYLIDFGIIDHKYNIYTDRNKSMLTYDYPYFPPEYKMYVYDDFYSFYKHFTNNFYYGFKFNGKREYILDHFKYLGMDINALCKQAHISFRGIRSNPEYFLNKIDLYSFGIVLFMCFIWSRIPNTIQNRKSTMKPKISKIDIIDNLMKNYLRALLQPDPMLRLSINEALKTHKHIIFILESLSSPSKRKQIKQQLKVSLSKPIPVDPPSRKPITVPTPKKSKTTF